MERTLLEPGHSWRVAGGAGRLQQGVAIGGGQCCDLRLARPGLSEDRRVGAAIDDYSSALRIDPRLASALYGRGLAKLKQGDKAGGNIDIAAAKAIQGSIADDFTRYGVQ